MLAGLDKDDMQKTIITGIEKKYKPPICWHNREMSSSLPAKDMKTIRDKRSEASFPDDKEIIKEIMN